MGGVATLPHRRCGYITSMGVWLHYLIGGVATHDSIEDDGGIGMQL